MHRSAAIDEGPGEGFTAQLRSIAEVAVVRTVPTATGFVTEHLALYHTTGGDITVRRIDLCEVTGSRITALTTYCNRPGDCDLRARHAALAPMIRPEPRPPRSSEEEHP